MVKRPYLKKLKETYRQKEKNKEEIEGVHNNTSALNKLPMAEVNILNETESFVRKFHFLTS